MLNEVFNGLPDSASVWMYAFDKPLSAEQETLVGSSLERFIVEWNSHGQPVEGRFLIVEKRFVVIAGHCVDGISGCSIDSKVRVFKELHDHYGLNALGGTRVFYRNSAGQIITTDRAQFRSLVIDNIIEEDTPVFDLTARTLEELRSKPIEQKFADSWAARAFARPVQENSPA